MVYLHKPLGKRVLMLGNAAIARGAIEADVKFVIGYPGTPSTEILEALAAVADELGIYVNWAINEKVALETAVGAAYAGARSLVTMKHLGFNVAADPLMTLAYTGVNGGLVLISADDPQCHTSQNEQDNRFFGIFAKIPVLEPSDPQEAKDMTAEAFNVSEKCELPVILRTTPRLSHASGDVVLGKIKKRRRRISFKKDPDRWVCVAAPALQRHKWLEKQQEKVRAILEGLPYNKLYINDDVDVGVVTVGIAYNYVMEALKQLKLENKVNVLKLCTSHPVAENLILELLTNVKKALIVEELDPIIEDYVLSIAKKHDLNVKLSGKFDGYLSKEGELSTDLVLPAIANFLQIKLTAPEVEAEKIQLPWRPLSLCAGCPHRGTYYSLKRILGQMKKDYIVTGDIGCSTIGKFAPFKILDTCLCMGASISMAAGFILSGRHPSVIAVVGDSTFLHAGIPALINVVYNNTSVKILILDNEVVAMTGFQPHPGIGITATGKETRKVSIEDVVKGCGVDFIKIVDPYDLKGTQETLKEAIAFNGPAVIIFSRECALVYRRKASERGVEIKPYHVDPARCTGCLICISQLGCPALKTDPKTRKIGIDEDVCIGCSVCAQICPFKAIVTVGGG